jgi:hypothetical protein
MAQHWAHCTDERLGIYSGAFKLTHYHCDPSLEAEDQRTELLHSPLKVGSDGAILCMIRFSLTGAAPNCLAPAERLVRRAAKRKTSFIIIRKTRS